jgi:GntR family histidine utilization transcriptional repressor
MTPRPTTEPRPLYARVKDHILTHINSGAWPAGTRVPSENEIVEQFAISRMTANRALKELTQEGFLSRLPGVGTFVAERPRHASLIEIRNIADEIRAHGHDYSNRIESLTTIEASPALAHEFETTEGTKLFHIVMVHEENGVPVQLEDRYVNPLVAPLFPKQDFTETTPTAYLVATASVDELEHTVEAIMPPSETRRLLAMTTDEPCLALQRRSWSGGHVVTVASFIYPASRYALYSRNKPVSRPHPVHANNE